MDFFFALLIVNNEDEIKKKKKLSSTTFSVFLCIRCLWYVAHDISNNINIGTDKVPYMFIQIAETASGVSG